MPPGWKKPIRIHKLGADYTRERIEILELGMDSLFNNDRVKKCKLTDFF